MKKIKTYRMSISRTFPVKHPKAGEETGFNEKIENAFSNIKAALMCKECKEMGHDTCGFCFVAAPSNKIEKLHTIRANYPLWKKRIDEVSAGEAELVLYEWTGKPYQSKTRELFRFGKDDEIGVQKLQFKTGQINGFVEDFERFNNEKEVLYDTLANNDGLSLQDFRDWFKGYDLEQSLAIIWFINKRY